MALLLFKSINKMVMEGTNPRGYRHRVRTSLARDLTPETYVSAYIVVVDIVVDAHAYLHKFLLLTNGSDERKTNADLVFLISLQISCQNHT